MSAICCFDATMSCDKITRAQVDAFLAEHCKHWVFQEECADSGFTHYQMRFSLGVRRRVKELGQLLVTLDMACHVSPTVTNNMLPNKAFYVMKPESRIAGPWSSEDPKPIVLPRQLQDKTLYPWQQAIVNDAEIFDTRHINVVVEVEGNKGKSFLTTWVGVHGIGMGIPPLNDYKDIMRMVMSRDIKKLYLIDMPRAIEQKKLGNFYAGIEELKSGHAWDDRYSMKEKYFDAPNIWIFTNVMPNIAHLSKDRWIIWKIENNELIKQE